MMRRLLIFDCDGTIVNTIEDVGLCFNLALRECGFPEYPLHAYNGFVGGNLETIVSRLLPKEAVCKENIDRVKAAYRAAYSASSKPHTVPYPGIVDMLKRLKAEGFTLAVNTNKGQKLTDELLGKLFERELFACVVGYEEERPSKPDPYGVDLICRRLGFERNDAVYIGDGHSDIQTAANAGIPCVLTVWGQTTEEDKQNPDVGFQVENAGELEALLMNEYWK